MPAAGIGSSRARSPYTSDEGVAAPAVCAALVSTKKAFSRWSQSGMTLPEEGRAYSASSDAGLTPTKSRQALLRQCDLHFFALEDLLQALRLQEIF